MKQLSLKTTRILGFAALMAAGLAISGQAQAASQCKGLENEACDAAAACSWVNAYERKDGRTVNAFCRTKAKRATDKEVSANKSKTQPQG